MQACQAGTLAETEVKFADKSACCVVMASKGYPEAYEKGYEITVDADCEANVFIAGAKLDGEKLVTSGGRVLGVVETADTLKEAVEKAYAQVNKVHFGNAFYRNDIGARALKAFDQN